jgi:hypothetical protein
MDINGLRTLQLLAQYASSQLQNSSQSQSSNQAQFTSLNSLHNAFQQLRNVSNDLYEDNISEPPIYPNESSSEIYLRKINNTVPHTIIRRRNNERRNAINVDMAMDSDTLLDYLQNNLGGLPRVNLGNREFEDVKTPLKQEVLKNMPKQQFKNLKENAKNVNCSICLEDFKDTEDVMILPCEHLFHESCIVPWLGQNSHKCPLCRSDCGEHRCDT